MAKDQLSLFARKRCIACKLDLSLGDFHRDRRRSDGLHPYCRNCKSEKSDTPETRARENARKRERYANDPVYREHRRALNQAGAVKYRETFSKNARSRYLLKTFGLTDADYMVLFDQQHGRCAVCGEPEKEVDPRAGRAKWLAVDHDHDSGKIRGLLCRPCNTSLGLLGDDLEGVMRLVRYLEGAG